MKRLIRAAAACLAVLWPTTLAADDMLLRAEPTGLKGREVLVWTNVFPPETHTNLHHHAGDEFVYVLEGSVIATVGGKSREMKVGAAFHVPAGKTMQLRNPSSNRTSKTLVFMLAVKGKPLSVKHD